MAVDDLDLTVIEQRHEPDPEFRAGLQRRVAAIVEGQEPLPRVSDAYEPLTLDLEPAPLRSEALRSRLAPRIVLVAASVAAIAALTAALVARDDTTAPAGVPDAGVPAATAPASLASISSQVATTTTPTTTVPSPTVDDLLPAAGVSTPETGELVAAVSRIHDGAWFLYADGRLISIDDHRPFARGWREQHLTPDGVERVRSDLLASGLFEASQQPIDAPSIRENPGPDPTALVRDGGTLLFCTSDSAPGTNCDLTSYFRDLASSLPRDEWADQQTRPYVPSRYAVCLTREQSADGRTVALDSLQSVLELLPSPAAQLLIGREPTLALFEAADSCFDLTISEARALAAAFMQAYPERLYTNPWDRASNVLGTIAQIERESTSIAVDIQLWPLLPAGGLALWGG